MQNSNMQDHEYTGLLFTTVTVEKSKKLFLYFIVIILFLGRTLYQMMFSLSRQVQNITLCEWGPAIASSNAFWLGLCCCSINIDRGAQFTTDNARHKSRRFWVAKQWSTVYNTITSNLCILPMKWICRILFDWSEYKHLFPQKINVYHL